MNDLYHPPTEEKKGLHTRCHSQQSSIRGETNVWFEVAEGWDAADIASELNRMAKEGLRIEDYRSYATAEGTAWGISVYTKKNGTLFILKDSNAHGKIDAFFKSIRYGNFRFVSAISDGQAIALTRESEE